MTGLRRLLLAFLAGSAAILSFDALRSRALESGLISPHAILPAGWLAALWALVIDVAAAAGILGVRADRADRRAWAMVSLAFGASVAFQVVTPPTAIARAVPPVALTLAVLVLELPRPGAARTDQDAASGASPEVGEGGAASAPLPDPLAALAELWRQHGAELSGAQLARALTDRGVQIGDRDARRLLALLRAEPAPTPSRNGDGNGQQPTLTLQPSPPTGS
jgi:hypothetical protein